MKVYHLIVANVIIFMFNVWILIPASYFAAPQYGVSYFATSFTLIVLGIIISVLTGILILESKKKLTDFIWEDKGASK